MSARPEPRARAAAPAQRGRSHPALEVTGPAAARDLFSAILWEAGTTGIEETPAGDLRAFFAAAPGPDLRQALRDAGAACVVGVTVPDADWVGRARRLHRAVRVGRLLLRAPWSRARPRAGEQELVIDPARAFGTGSHASTRLALRALARLGTEGRAVLDVGCGSGVLALRAAQLGARPVLAVDIDPEAVLATGENARRNGLARRLRVRRATAGDVRGRFALVLANLTAPILERERRSIKDRVAADGRLVVAGFLHADSARIATAFAEVGLRVGDERSEDAWAMLVLEPAGADAAPAGECSHRRRGAAGSGGHPR